MSAVGVTMAAGVLLTGVAGCNKGGSGGSGGGDGGVVATVNGSPITNDEYLRYMMLKPSVNILTERGPATARVSPPLGFQALEDLVQQRLVVQMARDENVYPSDDQVEKEMQFRVKSDPDFVKRLTSQGLSIDMIKEAMKVEMSQFNLLTKGITVTPDAIDAYIKANPKEFVKPPSVDLIWILARSEKTKQAAEQALRSGQTFDQVALQYSEAQNAKQSQGRLPIHQIEQLPKELQAPIAATPQLKSTDWIKAQDGWAKFYVERRAAATPVPTNSEEMREKIKRKIMLQRGSGGRELQARLQARLREAKVDVQFPGLQDSWKLFEDRMKSQNAAPSLESTVKASAGGTAGAATAGAATAGAATTGQ